MLKTVSNNFIIDSLNHACFMRNNMSPILNKTGGLPQI